MSRWLSAAGLSLALLSTGQAPAAGAPDDAAPSDCLDYAPARARLTGMLESRDVYGPPNFGETPAQDQKQIRLILRLDAPVCVNASADGFDPAETGQHEFTVQPNGTELLQFVGQRVTTVGTLRHAYTANDHTPLLLDPAQVTPAATGAAPGRP